MRSLWGVATALPLPQKPIFDLSVDFVQPLLGTLSLLPVGFNRGLELCNAILSVSKLLRKPLRHVDCMPAVFLSNVSSLAQKLKDRMTGFVELAVPISRILSRLSKLNYFRTY